ncbi:putative cytosolic iron-sulfur protein assembly protein 1 [Calycina marina]|uniref:Probable cytosolic iron-sulfur protein assembly protein 1 n=1 Tax=Calycina marina TaxID=1763456 RepID=A0A9P7Z321_9HELO|nr:putative cytosolic iron-sulfur protein assembly protein 1 [Calycina marina]
MAKGTLPLQISPLSEFKPTASSRAWVSIPNPNNLPLIATGTSDKTVRVYSLKNFTLHSTLEGGHTRSVRSVAWKPSTNPNAALNIASGSFDASIGLWRRQPDDATRESGQALEKEIAAGGLPEHSDGSEAEDDWGFMLVLEGHDSEVKNIAYSPSGQFLASCSRDKSIWIWEEVGAEGDDDWETIAVLQEHTADVKSICWRVDDGNGEVLASASYDDTIRLWKEVEEGEWGCFAELGGEDSINEHTSTVWSLAWEPTIDTKLDEGEEETEGSDSQSTLRLISSSADCTIRVWSLAQSEPQPNKPSYFNSSIPSTMRPAPADEKWVCVDKFPAAHDFPIYSIDWSKKTGRVVSTGGDGKVVIYEETTKGRSSVGGKIEKGWAIIGVLENAHGPYEINHVTWCTRYDAGRTKDGEEMIVTTGDDGIARAWAITESTEGAEVSVEGIKLEDMTTAESNI